ncbi:MAG: amidase [Gemmatimonadota bacterium]|nr:amidase [Gemmatimonadota bacterium]
MNPHSLRRTAALVRRGDTTALSIVEEAIRRHETSDLGAYIVFDADGARAQARTIDAAVAHGEDPGPLAGVTVSVKDLYGVTGLPIRAGTKRELPAHWRREGFLVRAMRRLGAVIVGKTHTVELAFGGVGLNPNTGTPVNPWDAGEHRAPGGSSAGAGVSLCEGSAMIALGSDTGGSVRIPASATGVVGHRHTTGRWPTSGVVPLSTTLDTVGLLTRTAADSRYAFGLIDVLAGNAPGPGPAAGHATGQGIDQGHRGHSATTVAGLRIGLPRSGLWSRTVPDIAAVVRRALGDLEAAGARVFEVDAPELDEAGERYLAGELVQPERFESLERDLPGWTPILDPTVGKRLESARDVSAVDYVAVLRARRRLSESIHARVEAGHIDLLATPTLPITPPPLSALSRLDVYRAVNRDMLSGTGPASMLDMCAVSLPAGLDEHGIPAGLQLIGPSGGDHALLERACAVESVLGTADERLGAPPRLTTSV